MLDLYSHGGVSQQISVCTISCDFIIQYIVVRDVLIVVFTHSNLEVDQIADVKNQKFNVVA